MKLRSHNNRRRTGASLMELLLYASLLTLLLVCGTRFFNIVYQHNKAVAKAAGFTASALDAGKHWRRDISNAKGEPRLIRSDEFDVIEIDQTDGGQVRYRVNQTRLERHNGEEWIPVVKRVSSYVMVPDPREHVRAWRWELALETKSDFLIDPARFSFVAVPGRPLAARPEKIPPPDTPEEQPE